MNVNIPEDKKRFLSKNYTKEGINSLNERLNSLLELYKKEIKYPYRVRILGYPTLYLKNKYFHEGMLLNMANVLGMTNIKIEVKNDN